MFGHMMLSKLEEINFMMKEINRVEQDLLRENNRTRQEALYHNMCTQKELHEIQEKLGALCNYLGLEIVAKGVEKLPKYKVKQKLREED